MDDLVGSLLEWQLLVWDTAGAILCSLFGVWFCGGVLRRLGVRRVSATWAGYLLTLLAFIAFASGTFGRDGLVVFGVSGLVWAGVLSSRRDSRRRRREEAAD